MADKANPEFQKYPTDKKKWDRNYLRIFGEKCPMCGGTGGGASVGWCYRCPKCNGIGYIEKRNEKT